jgi:hypothetical protein
MCKRVFRMWFLRDCQSSECLVACGVMGVENGVIVMLWEVHAQKGTIMG